MAATEGAHREGSGSAPPAARRFPLQPVSILFLVLGLALTGGLTAWSGLSYSHSEQRLTKLDVQLTGSAISASTADVERRLDVAITAVSYSGETSRFPALLQGSLGKAGPFVAAELFRSDASGLHLVSTAGAGLHVPAVPPTARQAARSRTLNVGWLTGHGSQRLAYALSASGPRGDYVGYALQVLPASRRIPVPKSSPASELYYAIYFGKTTKARDLLVTDAPSLPLSGSVAKATIPFGTAMLTVVAVPIHSLSGTFAQYVPWGILAAGILLSLAGLLLVEWLMRRRLVAEQLAQENQRLYEAQRNVSETLQRSLLPARLPKRANLTIAARYLPGTVGIEVGGDWYDVVEVDERQLFFSVGDVAGRGLEAAVIMTSLRNAIDAHATDGDEPGAVLHKIGRLVDVQRDGRFATVLCGLLDTETGDGIVVNAGHLPPVIVGESFCTVLETRQGPPLGLGDGYEANLFSLRPGQTMLCFTDGLVERRDEPVTDGIARLCAAADGSTSAEELLDKLLSQLVPAGGQADDVAILAMQRISLEVEPPARLGAGGLAEREGFEPSDPG